MDAKLTPEQVPIAERALAQRLLNDPATASELVAVAARACGNPDGDPCYRFTDRWLQKMRRAGFARHFRDGRRVFWSYTPEGFQTLNRMSTAA